MSQTVTIETIQDQTYTGAEIKPTPVLTGKEGLTESDYDVTYENNTNVGTSAKVIVTFKGKYTGTIEKQFTITPATPTMPQIQAPSDLKIGATLDELTQKLGTVQANGVGGEKLTGTLSLACDSFGKEAKTYSVKYTFTPDSKWTNYVTTPLTGTFDCTIQADASEDLSQIVKIQDIPDQPYTGSPIEPTLTLTGKEGLTESDYDITYQNNTDVGTATAIVTFKGKYTGKVEKQFAIVKSEYTGDKEVPASVLKNKSHFFDLPEAIGKLADVTLTLKPQASTGTVVEKAEISGKKLTVKTKTEATGTENVVVTVKSKNYNDFDLTYKLTVTNKKDVSSNIQFESATVTYDKKPHSLKPATLSGVTAGQNPKWTYTYTKNTADTSKVPEFTEVGVYHITATYEDDDNWGQKTTLTIESAASTSSITVTAEQRKGLADDNYNNFSIRLRDEANGYILYSCRCQ